MQSLDRLLHLVANVQFVCVKENQDSVGTVGEVVDDLCEVVGAVQSLLLSRQDARGIDEGDGPEHGRRHLHHFESVQEARPKLLQRVEGKVCGHGCRVARDRALRVSVHHRDELVGGRLGTHAHALVIALQQIANERRLTHRVLTDQQHHRLRLEVHIVHQSLVKLIIHVGLLDRAHLLGVARQSLAPQARTFSGHAA